MTRNHETVQSILVSVEYQNGFICMTMKVIDLYNKQCTRGRCEFMIEVHGNITIIALHPPISRVGMGTWMVHTLLQKSIELYDTIGINKNNQYDDFFLRIRVTATPSSVPFFKQIGFQTNVEQHVEQQVDQHVNIEHVHKLPSTQELETLFGAVYRVNMTSLIYNISTTLQSIIMTRSNADESLDWQFGDIIVSS